MPIILRRDLTPTYRCRKFKNTPSPTPHGVYIFLGSCNFCLVCFMMVKNSKVGATTLTKCKAGLYYHLVLQPPPLILGYHNWDILEEEEHMFMPQHKTLIPKNLFWKNLFCDHCHIKFSQLFGDLLVT